MNKEPTGELTGILCPGGPCPFHSTTVAHRHMPKEDSERLGNNLVVSEEARAITALFFSVDCYDGVIGDEEDWALIYELEALERNTPSFAS